MELNQNTQVYRTQAQTYRQEVLDNRQYIVSPVVAIVSGVLNGEFVPISEIANGFASWNGRPVTLDHPNVDGLYVTANDPVTWEQFVIGKLFHVAFADDRLKGEIWVDVEHTAATEDGAELLQRLQAGDPIEVSTAYFRELDPVAGEWQGIPYEGVAKDLKPDHLAILLHTAGACSWADGCGVPRLNQREVRADMPSHENETAGLDEVSDELNEQEPTANDDQEVQEQEPVMSWMDKLVGGLRNLFANQEASLEEQWDAVVSAFYQLIDSGQPVGDIGDGFVSKVFADYIIVERSDGMLFQVDYTQTDEGIEFGEQTQVEMVYQPVSNEDEATAEGPETEMPTEEPAVNEDADESDEPAVNETVEETEPETESEPEPATNEMADQETDEEAVDEAAPDEEPATNRCQEYVNLVEFADSHGGPEWALTQLQESVELKAQARQSLIEALAANAAVAFTVEDLKEFGDEALEKLRLTVEAPQANYSGTPAPAKPKEAPTGRRTIKLPPMRG